MSKLTCPVQIKQYLDRAEEFQSKRMYAEAIEQFRKAIQICPESAVAHNNLGSALANLGSYDEAETEFRQAIALAETDPYVSAPYLDAEQNLIRLGVARTEVPKSRISIFVVLGVAIAICFFSSLCGLNGDIRCAKIIAACGYLGAFALGRVLTNRPLGYFTVGAGIWAAVIFSLNIIFRRNIDGVTDAIVFSAINMLGFLATYHAASRGSVTRDSDTLLGASLEESFFQGDRKTQVAFIDCRRSIKAPIDLEQALPVAARMLWDKFQRRIEETILMPEVTPQRFGSDAETTIGQILDYLDQSAAQTLSPEGYDALRRRDLCILWTAEENGVRWFLIVLLEK